MLQPMDNVYDNFLADPYQKILFSYDYPTNLPNTDSNSGLNMHWVMMKPDPAFYDTLVNAYVSTEYSPDWGWNSQEVKNFDGVLGVKGFLAHYFTRINEGANGILQRCIYGNDNSDPSGTDASGNTVCRDPGDCQDCRALGIESSKVIKIIHTCGKPWECSYNEGWDDITKSTCEAFHRAWFSARIDFEQSCWEGGPTSVRAGTFHPDAFMGFCDCAGEACYESMIPDKNGGGVVVTSAPVPVTIPVTSAPVPVTIPVTSAPVPVTIPVTSPPTSAPVPVTIPVTSSPTKVPTPMPTPPPTLATLPPTPEPTLASVVSFTHQSCQNYAVHAGTAITFAANDIQGGDIGYGTALVGAYDLQDGGVLVNMLDSSVFAASVVQVHAAAMVVRPNTVDFAGAIGGLTFAPGTYRSIAAVSTAALTVVTLDGGGDENAVWLFQAATLGTAAGSSFRLINGAKAENVLWALSSAATLGADSHFEGSIIAGTAITFGAGASMHGCLLAITAITFGAAASVVSSMEVNAETGLLRHLRGPFQRGATAF